MTTFAHLSHTTQQNQQEKDMPKKLRLTIRTPTIRTQMRKKLESLTLKDLFEILNAECPNDGMCLYLDSFIKSKGWVIRPFEK